MPLLFSGDDEEYLRWVDEHPDGYVVNVRRNFDPSYVVLHRSSCHTIRSYVGIWIAIPADSPNEAIGSSAARALTLLPANSVDGPIANHHLVRSAKFA